MATTTVTEPIPAEVLEDFRDNLAQAQKLADQAAQMHMRAAHMEGESSGFLAAANRLVERKLGAKASDVIDPEKGTITRVVEVPDPPSLANGPSAEPEE
jgi:hypothetical protein